MKPKYLNIRLENNTLSPVKVSKILTGTGLKAFIWKETLRNGHSFYHVNEFYTGMSLGISCPLLSLAEEKFLLTARNEAYWQNEKMRVLHNQGLVKNALASYGHANQD